MKDIHHDLAHEFKRARWGLILRGLLALAFGVFALARPMQTVAILALVVAFWAIFTGIEGIVYGLDLRHYAKHWWVVLAGGVISTLFGIAAFFLYPTLSIAFLVIWTAWWFFSIGVMEIITALQKKKEGWSWGWHMVLGVVSILAAGVALLAPPATLMALTFWIGFSALAFGIVLLVLAGSTRHIERKVTDAVSDRTDPGEKPRRAA